MNEHISPEEKLLRLIRGPRAQSAVAAVKHAFPAGIALRARSLFFPARVRGLFGSARFYYGLTAVSAVLLIGQFVVPVFFLQRIRSLKAADSVVPALKADASSAAKPFAYYSESLGGRELFGRLAVVDQGETLSGPAKARAADTVANLTLMGIISGDHPQAIIEDKKSQKTSYVSKGQSVGEVKIEDIQEGKIIVNCNGERFELYM